MSQRPRSLKKLSISAAWSHGHRTSHWDLLWTRLLSYALTSLPQSPEVEEAVVTADEVKGTGGDVRASEGPGRPAAG
mgnify:CR=1 FL=1